MPTIEELFRSKKLSSGKTAEEQYAVRNSKDNELTSAAGLMGLPFKAATAIRRKISTTGKETLIEQETTGLRIISKLSSPIIYGTKIARFTLQQSDDVMEMKSARVEQWAGIGTVTTTGINGGLLGGLVNAGRGLINSVKVILGVPQNITPTKIYLNTDVFNSKNVGVFETMSTLAEIQKKGGGKILGKLLAKGIGSGGTINQLGNSIPGAAAEAGKSFLKNLLLGSGQAGQINLAKNQGGAHRIYASWDYHGMKLPLDRYYLFDSYSNQSNSVPGETYSLTKAVNSTEIENRNDLSTRFNSIKGDGRFPEKTIIEARKLNKYTKYNKERFNKDSLENKLGLTTNVVDDNGRRFYGNYNDSLNEIDTYKPGADGTAKDSNQVSYDEYDFVALKFHSITLGTTAQFRATITGLTETFAPTWDSNKFIGNPFNFYTYSGIERSVQFNFKVYSLSILEHLAAWERLNFLASLVYPTYGGAGGNYTVPPFLKFTLGNMYRNKECFIDSLIYTVDDNNMWEIGLNTTNPKYADLKLPTIIDVGITLKFVESKSSTNKVKLYGFGPIKAPAPANKGTGNSVTGTGANKLIDIAIPPPPIVPDEPGYTNVNTSKRPKRLDGSIIPNPTVGQLAEKTKASADTLLNKKLLDKISIGQQMKPPSENIERKIDVTTPDALSKQDDSGTNYPIAGNYPPPSTPIITSKPNASDDDPYFMAQVPSGGGASAVGWLRKDGTVDYFKPEDYNKYGVPGYGKDFIKNNPNLKIKL